MHPDTVPSPYWSVPAEERIAALETRRTGLTCLSAADFLQRHDRKTITTSHPPSPLLTLFLDHFRNPLILMITKGVLQNFPKKNHVRYQSSS
jgi:hypothetical protein